MGLSGWRGGARGRWGAASASWFGPVLGPGRGSWPDFGPSRRRLRPPSSAPLTWAPARPLLGADLRLVGGSAAPRSLPTGCQKHPANPRRWDDLTVSRLRQGSPPRSRSTALGYAAPLTSQPLRAGALVPVCLSGSGTSRNIHPESPRATRGQPPFPAEPLSGAGSVDLELGRVTRAPKTHICGALVLNPAALF